MIRLSDVSGHWQLLRFMLSPLDSTVLWDATRHTWRRYTLLGIAKNHPLLLLSDRSLFGCSAWSLGCSAWSLQSSPPQDELIFPASVIVVTESHDSVLAQGLSEKVCWAEAQKSNKPLKKRALLTPLKSSKSLQCMELLQPFYNQKVKKKKSADYIGKDISSQPAEAALGVASRLPVK